MHSPQLLHVLQNLTAKLGDQKEDIIQNTKQSLLTFPVSAPLLCFPLFFFLHGSVICSCFFQCKPKFHSDTMLGCNHLIHSFPPNKYNAFSKRNKEMVNQSCVDHCRVDIYHVTVSCLIVVRGKDRCLCFQLWCVLKKDHSGAGCCVGNPKTWPQHRPCSSPDLVASQRLQTSPICWEDKILSCIWKEFKKHPVPYRCLL